MLPYALMILTHLLTYPSASGPAPALACSADIIVSADARVVKWWLAVLACILAIACVVLVILWAEGADIARGYLGGIDYETHRGTLHPIMMITSMIFLTSLVSPKFESRLSTGRAA